MEKNSEHHSKKDRVFFGFWLYLMTDLLMFAVLFATFAVLRNNTNGLIAIGEIFEPPFVLAETVILLVSSFLCGLGVLFAQAKEKRKALVMLFSTLLLGIMFLGMEIYEFTHLIFEGYGPSKSAFLSSFFTLVGFHGLHIFGGAVWLTILIAHILLRGLMESNIRKLRLLGIFWHFLDLVWIFIFTIVYLFGGIL